MCCPQTENSAGDKNRFLASWIQVYDSTGKVEYLWAELGDVKHQALNFPGAGSGWSGVVRQSLAVSHGQDTLKGLRQGPSLKQ